MKEDINRLIVYFSKPPALPSLTVPLEHNQIIVLTKNIQTMRVDICFGDYVGFLMLANQIW